MLLYISRPPSTRLHTCSHPRVGCLYSFCSSMGTFGWISLIGWEKACAYRCQESGGDFQCWNLFDFWAPPIPEEPGGLLLRALPSRICQPCGLTLSFTILHVILSICHHFCPHEAHKQPMVHCIPTTQTREPQRRSRCPQTCRQGTFKFLLMPALASVPSHQERMDMG